MSLRMYELKLELGLFDSETCGFFFNNFIFFHCL